MGVRMRINRSATGNRRSHHGLSLPRLSKCAKCDAYHIRHRMCSNCGTYRGREVIDVLAITTKKEKKRKARLTEGQPLPSEKQDSQSIEDTTKEKSTASEKEKGKEPLSMDELLRPS